MAKYVRTLDGTGQMPMKFAVNDNQTIVRGSALIIATGKVSLADDATSAGETAGFAMEPITTVTATDADVILVDVNPNSVYNLGYWSASTNVPAIGVAYDWKSDGVIDADDTTGGYFMCVGNVNTTAGTCDVMMGNRFNQVG